PSRAGRPTLGPALFPDMLDPSADAVYHVPIRSGISPPPAPHDEPADTRQPPACRTVPPAFAARGVIDATVPTAPRPRPGGLARACVRPAVRQRAGPAAAARQRPAQPAPERARPRRGQGAHRG